MSETTSGTFISKGNDDLAALKQCVRDLECQLATQKCQLATQECQLVAQKCQLATKKERLDTLETLLNVLHQNGRTVSTLTSPKPRSLEFDDKIEALLGVQCEGAEGTTQVLDTEEDALSSSTAKPTVLRNNESERSSGYKIYPAHRDEKSGQDSETGNSTICSKKKNKDKKKGKGKKRARPINLNTPKTPPHVSSAPHEPYQLERKSRITHYSERATPETPTKPGESSTTASKRMASLLHEAHHDEKKRKKAKEID